MMLKFKKTPVNETFAAAMAAETRAKARRIAAQASFFELAGWGLVLSGGGLGLWLACLGVVRFNGENSKTQEGERAFIERVAATPLKGEVTVKTGGEVAVKTGGQVSLPPDTTIHLDATRPTPAQIQASAKPASGAPVMTDVVKFSIVDHGKGQVVTGWRFGDSSQGQPFEQWCLYRELAPDGAWRFVNIGEDGKAALPDPSPFPSVDLQRALASCVWSNSRAPDSRTAAPAPRVISARAKG
jgi:hypothetical protein